MQNNILSRNIRYLIRKFNLNETQLADSLGITQSTIHRIASGQSRDPKTKNINLIADYFNINPDDLRNRDLFESNIKLLAPMPVKGRCPFIIWAELAAFLKGEDMNCITHYCFTEREDYEDCFATTVQGISMQNDGQSISFCEGDIILASRKQNPENGKFVIVKIHHTDSYIFRKLVIENNKKYLFPLNPKFQMEELSKEDEIIGVVFEKRISL